VKVPPPPIVTLLTDFGAGSGYPAQMKGVILSLLPGATLVDLSHEVPRHDVLAGALLLEACAPRFPASAVHVAVVDPGVGTARRPLSLVDGSGRRFVGPDNGLLTPFLDGGRIHVIADRKVVPGPFSATFHGRDVFAPAAAWLAGGGAVEDVGPAIADPVRLEWKLPERRGGEIHGECLTSDSFGNVLTSIRDLDLLGGQAEVDVAGRRARFVSTYGDGRPGELLALLGSSGRLEISVREGNAAQLLGFRRGDRVVARIS
jgi:S-adenosylmethionine hydrolase